VRAICDVFRPGLRLTAHQSLLFTDIGEDQQKALGELLTAHGVQLSHQISQVRRWSMACVAWPTCGLSIAEAERALPGLVNRLERELAELGLADEQFTLRMTGCPNGCARPYNAVIGLVGKAKGRYTVYLGGNTLGTRLAFLYKDLVPEEDLVPVLTATFACFKEERLAGESLGDFYCRQGPDRLAAWHERQLDRRKGAA
jgi:sulfite reductase (ferredoxin)